MVGRILPGEVTPSLHINLIDFECIANNKQELR